MSNIVDCLIVGGGPAGLTASIYCKRSGLNVLVLEKESFGGQIATSPKVENYPTIKSISGSELIERMIDQVTELGVDIDIDEVKHIERNDGIFHVIGEFSTYLAKTVILATGCVHRKLKAEGIDDFQDSGVSYCAVCDGSFYEGKDVCLVGDANTALQYSILLSNICRKVYVCTLFDKFFGERPLVDALLKKENVEVIHNVSLKTVNGNDKIESLDFENTKTKEIQNIKVDGLFVAIGQIPNNKDFENLVDLDEQGYFDSNETCKTKTEGLYVAGDARRKDLRQVATAISDGAQAATLAVNYILNK